MFSNTGGLGTADAGVEPPETLAFTTSAVDDAMLFDGEAADAPSMRG
jgi:hypothetical protein